MATIQGVYIALFGRPADPLGLSFFNTATGNGANLTGIGPLQSSAEFQARFTGQSNVQIINSIYQSLFNRAADLPGLTFFANALATGTLSINNIAIAIYDGAQGADLTIRNLKEAAANAFTKAIDTTAEVVGYNGTAAANSGVAFLTGVTTTAPTQAQVDAAVLAATTTTGSGTAGNILTLTAGVDVFTTTATGASLTSVNDDTIRAIAANSLDATDVIKAGAGNDTLNISDAAYKTGDAPVIESVEKINFTLTSADSTFNMSAVTGTTDITTTGGKVLTVNNTTTATTFGINNGTTDQITVTLKDATGTNDSVKLFETNSIAANGNSVAKFVIDGIENATVTVGGTSTGTHAIDVGASGAGASTLKVVTLVGSSSGQVTLTDTNSVTTITTVDGSGLTKAGVTFNATGYTKITTFNGGAGADAVTLTTQTGVKVTGGAGADTVDLGTGSATAIFKAGDSTLTGGVDTYTNFTTGTDKIDLTAITLTNKSAIGTSALTTPAGDVAGLFTIGGTQFGVVKINAGADIAIDVNNDGNFSAGTDLYIKGLGGAVLADYTFA